MTSRPSTTGIPFPQAQATGSSSSSSSNQTTSTSGWRTMDDVRYAQSSSTAASNEALRPSTSSTLAALAPPPSPPYRRGQYQGRGHGTLSAIRTDSANSSYPSSSSRHYATGLPSIRNLLNSIGQDEQQTGSRHVHLAGEEQPSSGHANFSSFAAHDARHSPHGVPVVRSLSPSKRPPIAPSAFAHSQYPSAYQHTAGRSPHEQIGNILKRSPPSLSAHTPLQPSDPRSLRVAAAPGLRHAHVPVPLSLAGDNGRAENVDGEGQGQMLAKRAMNARSDLDEVPLSPASLRRRHTVGALDEPSGPRFEEIKREQDSTPRSTHAVQRLASPARIGLESPTTPTAGNAVSSADWRSESHAAAMRSDAMIRGKNHSHAGPTAPAQAPTSYMYMQNSSQGTGSMPSLSSSISSASAGSDRARVLSLENAAVHPSHSDGGKHPPSAWNPSHMAHPKASISGGSETLTSPHSSVWHSRSSTLDSIDTSSSLGSTPSGKSHGRMQMMENTIREAQAPTTPTHNRDGYNRDWRFPQPQQQQRAQQYAAAGGMHAGLPRTRHESLNSQSSDYSVSSAGYHLPRSPFANLSLTSPSDAGGGGVGNVMQDGDGQYVRPRAQTMTYYDRRIAPLPSHSVHAYSAAPTGEFAHDRRFYAPSPQRSFSSQSASSLPHRIAAMDVDVEGGYAVGGGGASPYGSSTSPRRRLSSSSGHAVTVSPAGNTVIVNASAAGSAAGAAKYECGWCGKRFSRPSSLKIHHHSHTGEKPFVCGEPGCGRTFSVQSNLRRHQKSHIANARRAAGGSVDTDNGTSTASTLSRSGSFQLPHSTSMPLTSSSAAKSLSAHAASYAHGNRLTSTSPKNQLQRFGSLRERKTSISSSAAADDELDPYGAIDDTEIDDDGSIHGAAAIRSIRHAGGGGGGKRRYSYEAIEAEDGGELTINADAAMQDIREEGHGTGSSSPSSSEDRPPTANSMQARFQGLLKAGGGGGRAGFAGSGAMTRAS